MISFKMIEENERRVHKNPDTAGRQQSERNVIIFENTSKSSSSIISVLLWLVSVWVSGPLTTIGLFPSSLFFSCPPLSHCHELITQCQIVILHHTICSTNQNYRNWLAQVLKLSVIHTNCLSQTADDKFFKWFIVSCSIDDRTADIENRWF